MHSEISAVANSGLLLVLCAVPVAIIAVQAIIFLVRAWKEAGRLGISVETRRKVITNSAVFSIIPSLLIIIIMAVLTLVLGYTVFTMYQGMLMPVFLLITILWRYLFYRREQKLQRS